MALELKLKYEVTSDRTKLIVTDETGVYCPDNLTGWGTPNTERNATGLYCYVTYQPFSTALEPVVAITSVYDFNISYVNNHVSSFEFNYVKDGWYRILLVALTEAEYAAVVDPEDLINSLTYPNVFVEDIVLINLVAQRNCLLEKYIECIQCTSCKCEPVKEDVTKLNLLIQGTDYRFYSDKQFEAQKMTEQLTRQYKCCK